MPYLPIDGSNPYDPYSILNATGIPSAVSGAAGIYAAPQAVTAGYAVINGVLGVGGTVVGLTSSIASTAITVAWAYTILQQSGLLPAINAGIGNFANMMMPAAAVPAAAALGVPNIQQLAGNLPALAAALPVLGVPGLPATGLPGLSPEAIPVVASLATQALQAGVPGLPPVDLPALAANIPALAAALPQGLPPLPQGLPPLPGGLPALPLPQGLPPLPQGLPPLPGGLPALPAGLPWPLPALPEGLPPLPQGLPPLPALPEGLPPLPALPPLPPNPIPQKICVGGIGPIGFCTP